MYIEKAHVKRVIKTLVRKLFFQQHNDIVEDEDLHISDTDKDIAQYLAGATSK